MPSEISEMLKHLKELSSGDGSLYLHPTKANMLFRWIEIVDKTCNQQMSIITDLQTQVASMLSKRLEISQEDGK